MPSLAEQAILQSVIDGDAYGLGGLAAAALRQEAVEKGYRPRPASADTRPKGGDANAAPFTSGAVPEGETPKGDRP